jgi:hypothetical protein
MKSKKKISPPPFFLSQNLLLLVFVVVVPISGPLSDREIFDLNKSFCHSTQLSKGKFFLCSLSSFLGFRRLERKKEETTRRSRRRRDAQTIPHRESMRVLNNSVGLEIFKKDIDANKRKRKESNIPVSPKR